MSEESVMITFIITVESKIERFQDNMVDMAIELNKTEKMFSFKEEELFSQKAKQVCDEIKEISVYVNEKLYEMQLSLPQDISADTLIKKTEDIKKETLSFSHEVFGFLERQENSNTQRIQNQLKDQARFITIEAQVLQNGFKKFADSITQNVKSQSDIMQDTFESMKEENENFFNELYEHLSKIKK